MPTTTTRSASGETLNANQQGRDDAVLSVSNLSVVFGEGPSRVLALDKVSLDVRRGEVLSLVGESGCGKSVTAMAVMGLLPRRGVERRADTLSLCGESVLGLSERRLKRLRGGRMGIVFQDPMTSLNPVHTIGTQIGENIRRHKGVGWAEARRRTLELLDRVRIPDAARRIDAFPHELSGGMRQRVMIALATACDPALLIADEPTTALDVTIQAQILTLLRDLSADTGMGILLITHDLGVVAETADRVAVMYAGRIVEMGTVEEVFARPSHGYTAGLMRALPGEAAAPRSRLSEIEGTVPRIATPPEGCAFAPRCAFAREICAGPLGDVAVGSDSHRSACARTDAVFQSVRDLDIVRAWE
ncbi:MAG: ABC transporter ATP-binding protein [Pseudomonadota bacterium]